MINLLLLDLMRDNFALIIDADKIIRLIWREWSVAMR